MADYYQPKMMLPEEIVGKGDTADLQFVSQPTPASNESKNNNGEINSTSSSSSSSTQPSSLLAASVDSTNNENIAATTTAARSAYTGIIVGGQKIFAPPSSSSRPTSSSSFFSANLQNSNNNSSIPSPPIQLQLSTPSLPPIGSSPPATGFINPFLWDGLLLGGCGSGGTPSISPPTQLPLPPLNNYQLLGHHHNHNSMVGGGSSFGGGLLPMAAFQHSTAAAGMMYGNGLMNLPGIGQVCHHSSGLPSYVTDKTHSNSSVIFSDTSGGMAGNNTFFRKSTYC